MFSNEIQLENLHTTHIEITKLKQPFDIATTLFQGYKNFVL